jgi:hypothetical protein
MYWTLLLKISATALLLTAGLLTIPHALLGATLKNILFGAAAISGVITALSAFKLIGVNKTRSESEANRLNSETMVTSKDHSDDRDDD